MNSWIACTVLSLSLLGCATGKCDRAAASSTTGTTTGTAAEGTAAGKPVAKEGVVAMKPESKLDRVKVYKFDGSLQCGQGKAIATSEMEKDLKGMKVYSSYNKNDGMMRIQVCGSPTGNSNVYEIDRTNLAAALKLGFKEWTQD